MKLEVLCLSSAGIISMPYLAWLSIPNRICNISASSKCSACEMGILETNVLHQNITCNIKNHEIPWFWCSLSVWEGYMKNLTVKGNSLGVSET
jgi:hypothetical protein